MTRTPTLGVGRRVRARRPVSAPSPPAASARGGRPRRPTGTLTRPPRRERARGDGRDEPTPLGRPGVRIRVRLAGRDTAVEPDHEVELLVRPAEGRERPEFFYDPCGLYVDPGDTVKFSYTTPHHTITAYHPARGEMRRVPEGVPPFSSPVLNAGAYWLYTFEIPGVYDLYCGPHEAFGHAMRIVVGTTAGYEPLPDPCAAPAETPTGTETEAPTAATTPTAMETRTPTATATTTETGTGMSTATETPADADTPTEEGGEGAEPELRLPLFTGLTVLRDPALDPENVVADGEVRWGDLAAESKRLFLRVEGFPPCSTDEESE